jgi:tryptophanyl-tRNA synthetase
MVESLAPIAERFNELRADRESLDAILARGASKAREMGAPTLASAYTALGLVRG